MKTKTLVISIGLIVLVGLGAWWLGTRNVSAAASQTLEVTGTIEARKVNLSSEMGGKVLDVLAEEGESVSAGQPLVQIDDTLWLQATQLRNEAELYQDAFMLKNGLHYIPELSPYPIGVGEAGQKILLPRTGDISSSKQLLKIVNEYNQEGKFYESLGEVSVEQVERALANREADLAKGTLEVEKAVPSVEPLAPP